MAPDILVCWKALLEPIILALAVVLLLAAAYGDASKRLIPNALTAAIAILGIARLVVTGDPIAASYTVGAAFLVLLITFVLFSFRFIGGGDVKLLTAAVLLTGYRDLFSFLSVMSICGALVSIAILILYRSHTRPSVPYGVAIAAGAMVTLKSSLIG